ncbi:4-hydroxy-3-methylbut-2-enyl diphosphate reductase [Marivirga harenae]|mgnify:CR=1 FL=1|uniref:4-hydroxy-3-methylbut-2-enyl diphosphate reductase n=1 Tax=Marivirga harenae TaxID=2010992 RepID=UPI0026DF8AFF|nr:4-hydroxy-3-methylbut-2-enyl diphosphate reductase [Marivirga harenae]WKV10724.1 4-hydroxy-3-methylbut-2-enyl diphosphate reductase [Marivirga harenae]|tara:strand:+ start:101624 stop:102469 length:846 start_codon:yes stop_codon:yes gene_type:complete
MMNLNVKIDNSSGFCFGVVYAIEMAEDMLDEQGYLYCLGDIVHNDEEVKRLEAKGLKIIDREALKDLHGEKVLIRAHGEPPSTYKLAIENNLTLVDASCPVVLKLQNRIKNSFDKKEQIYIYGKHGHAEVEGLLGQTNQEAVVFQDINELDIDSLPREMTLYSQTTKSTDNFYKIKETLTEAGISVNANDTICRQVSNRDKELRSFAGEFDKVVFVSGTKSSNGKVLYNVCKDKNPNTYFISNITELDKDWFSENDSVGICGATSTPMWLMEQVRDELSKL